MIFPIDVNDIVPFQRRLAMVPAGGLKTEARHLLFRHRWVSLRFSSFLNIVSCIPNQRSAEQYITEYFFL